MPVPSRPAVGPLLAVVGGLLLAFLAGRRSRHDAPSGPSRARRVTVTEPLATGRPHDYADAFELRLVAPERCTPEEWVRAGVDASPVWIQWIAGAPDGLARVRVVESSPEVVVFADSDGLHDTVMVGRNVEPGRRILTTVLHYRRPVLARVVWAGVGILHRRTARRVLAGGL